MVYGLSSAPSRQEGPSPLDQWRRNGGGMMAATFLVGGTWLTSSVTFVTTSRGHLVHASPWGWLLWVCIAGFVFGAYVWLSTYVDKLPMFGRKKARSETFNRFRFSSVFTQTGPVQVELVRTGRERPIPFLAPELYQVDQFRQALAKLRECPFEEFGLVDLDMMLRKLDRTDTDPVYEPLHVYPGCSGLIALIASGDLVEVKPGTYRLPANDPENSGTGSESS